MKKYLILFFFVITCFIPLYGVKAAIYQVHFKYDQKAGFLTFDDSNPNPVSIDQDQDISPVAFYQEVSDGKFEIVFMDYSGEEIVRKNFDPTATPVFVLDTPYYSFAKSIEIFKSGSTDPILSFDLSQLSTCNQNNVCEYEKGENFTTCLADCTGTDVQFSEETTTTLQQNGGIVRDPKTGDILLNDVKPEPTPQDTSQTQADESKKSPLVSIALLVAGILMLVGVAVYFIRRRK